MNIFVFLGRLLKPLLFPFSLIYGLIIWLRNKIYDKGIYSAIRFSIPVISVGNLSTGGTGKTPHIEYLIRLLMYEFRVATMSRGYKRRSRGFLLADEHSDAASLGDEPMQFHRKFPGIAVSVCEERMTGIPELMSRCPETEVILLDDAYQHRSVQPGLNILITDYYKPFYEDFILPFGSLREGRKSYMRADIIIVSKCPGNLPDEQKQHIRSRIRPLPHQQVFFSTVRYEAFADFFSGEPLRPETDTHFVLVSGIARPEPLSDYLRTQGAPVHVLRYADHHYFTESDLSEIRQTIQQWQVARKAIIVSEKDAVRLLLHKDTLSTWGVPVYVLPISICLLEDADAFHHLVRAYIERERAEAEY